MQERKTEGQVVRGMGDGQWEVVIRWQDLIAAVSATATIASWPLHVSLLKVGSTLQINAIQTGLSCAHIELAMFISQSWFIW